MKHLLLFILVSAFFIPKIYAQEKPCEVAMESIKGTYTGSCSDGKANGSGRSVGADEYEGEFRNGYPDGKGKYTWKDQHYYNGSWKKGKMEGQGEMHYKKQAGDSVVTGFWKKDKYVGQYEKQFVVVSTSNRINKVDCRLRDKNGDDLFFTIHQQTNSNGLALPYISNIIPSTGTYYTNNYQVLTNNTLARVQQVTFPFKAVFTLSNNESVEILFNERGNYDIYIDVQ